eukprot:7251839-Karenia_brevis.AAC.1
MAAPAQQPAPHTLQLRLVATCSPMHMSAQSVPTENYEPRQFFGQPSPSPCKAVVGNRARLARQQRSVNKTQGLASAFVLCCLLIAPMQNTLYF